MENKPKNLLKVQFLGTASSLGMPVIGYDHPVSLSQNPKDFRLRSSIFLQQNDTQVVIDCGPDFRTQMLQLRIKELDGIVFTHEHADHTAGLDDVRPFNFLMQRPMPIYAEERVMRHIQHRFDYCFKEPKYPGAPDFDSHLIDEKGFTVGEIKFQPIRIQHGNLPILGFRIDDFCYITDAGEIYAEELEKLKGLKVLVINALRRERRHHSQFILEEALEIIEKVQPEKAYLTHVSPNLGFHDEVQASLPENIFLAYDGLTFEV